MLHFHLSSGEIDSDRIQKYSPKICVFLTFTRKKKEPSTRLYGADTKKTYLWMFEKMCK